MLISELEKTFDMQKSINKWNSNPVLDKSVGDLRVVNSWQKIWNIFSVADHIRGLKQEYERKIDSPKIF